MKAKPDTFDPIFYQDVDFDRAFRVLDGHEHFFTETLRGKVRMHPLRFEEAAAHYDRAEDLFRLHDIDSENLRLYFVHRADCLALLSMREALHPTAASALATDDTLRRLQGLDYAENDIRLWNLLNLQRTIFRVLRGDFSGAAEILNDLMEEARYQFQEHHVLIYTLASGVFRQLGDLEESQRHFENAVNGIGMLRRTYSLVFSHYRFYCLLEIWKDRTASEQWLARAEKLRVSEATHAGFRKRAEILIGLFRSNDRFFMD